MRNLAEPGSIILQESYGTRQSIIIKKFRQVARIARDSASASTRDTDSARDSASARELEIIENFLHPITS